ncbi:MULTISPECIES: hypothetical protein [Legionella]|uniref:Uncharacterized protein n=1 Tax=Legionella maceachernii TaxID=466 RepID=A0A0W0VZJ8_9GAMM|nr:hypothetical protein [Legionella maceachernii]KTD25616.1 hypothetical protein Lmac_1980 [Legionella maceachernii]SJZ57628.1 hypothetical protein SAMN02745128_00471 [Legionella maceachernii]SUP00643.1 Uncharacterised protein [Legionella maceachernii]
MHKLASYRLAIPLILNVFCISTASAASDVCEDNSLHQRTIYNYSTQKWFINGKGNSIPGAGYSSVWFTPCNEKTSFGCTIHPKSQISISYAGVGGLVPRPPSGYITLTDMNGIALDFRFGCHNREIYLSGSVASTVMLLNQPKGGDMSINSGSWN